MSAREQILNRVRNALGRDTSVESVQPEAVRTRLTQPLIHTQPASADDQISTLIRNMESVQMSVVRLQSEGDVVAAVDWYLEQNDIDGDLSISPSLADLAWKRKVHVGPATGTETTSVTSCFAAIAETGSIAFKSGSDTPATLNFLPEHHLVVLRESQIVDHPEAVWDLMRTLSLQPRAINLVTGPSRTADIEQTIELGAHGPRSMHVMLVSG